MWSKTLNILFCAVWACGQVLAGGEDAWGSTRKGTGMVSPVKISIKLPQTEYRIGEPLDGKVVLTNHSPSNIPAVFEIRLYHDGELASSLSTSLKGVPQGTTRFAFKNFGIPSLTNGPDAEGNWRILIYQRGLEPSQGTEVTLEVVKPSRSSKPEKKKPGKRGD